MPTNKCTECNFYMLESSDFDEEMHPTEYYCLNEDCPSHNEE